MKCNCKGIACLMLGEMNYLDLSKNSSNKPGCMRRSPASHCCHVRKVLCMSAAAWVWVSFARSRAARISVGSGLEEGPCGPRLGWLDIGLAVRVAKLGKYVFSRHVRCVKRVAFAGPLFLRHNSKNCLVTNIGAACAFGIVGLINRVYSILGEGIAGIGKLGANRACDAADEGVVHDSTNGEQGFYRDLHFYFLGPCTRGAEGSDLLPMNELYTRIERMTTTIFNGEKLVHLGGSNYALEGSALAKKFKAAAAPASALHPEGNT